MAFELDCEKWVGFGQCVSNREFQEKTKFQLKHELNSTAPTNDSFAVFVRGRIGMLLSI